MDSNCSLNADSNGVLTYQTLEHLTRCFMEETDEMLQEYERKRTFLLERQGIITDNDRKLTAIGHYTDLLKATMSNVEQQLAYQEQFLNQMDAYINPMVVICNKMICNCPYCAQQCSEVNRVLRTLENLNLGVQAIYDLMERVTSHRDFLITCSSERKHPYHIIGQILQTHCSNLQFVEKSMQEIMQKIQIVNELFWKNEKQGEKLP